MPLLLTQVIDAKSIVDVTPDLEHIVITDPNVLKTILALDEDCVVTITIRTDCDVKPSSKPLGAPVIINPGCIGGLG